MKKLNKLVAVLVALAMMAALAVTTAFAEGPAHQGSSLQSTGFTKTWKVPNGVSHNKGVFSFKIDPDSSNPSGATTAWYETITIDAGTSDGEETGFKRLSDVFTLDENDTTDKVKLTEAGEYKFVIEEVSGEANGVTTDPTTGNASYFLQDSEGTSEETVTYDTHKYVLRIYLQKNAKGELEEKAITVVDQDDDDDGKDDDKIDPTEKTDIDDKDTDDTEDDEVIHLEVSDWNFENGYKKETTDTVANGGAFNIQKTAAESAATNVAYPFTVTITVDEQTVADLEDGKTYDLTDTAGNTWSFTKNGKTVSKDVNIKPGADEKLIFTKFPAGATVQIVEKMNDNTTTIQNKDKYTAKAEGTGITFDTTETKQGVNLDRSAIYDAKASVNVTNKLDSSDITPEGIMINNLPYIVLALVAVGGLVAYVVVRRKADDEA